jgi:hypothetical protein
MMDGVLMAFKDFTKVTRRPSLWLEVRGKGVYQNMLQSLF